MKDKKTIKGPGASELDDIRALSGEQAKVLREGFAAHVAGNAAFHQAVKELQKTQNPRAMDQAMERRRIEISPAATSMPAPAPLETEASPTEPPIETATPPLLTAAPSTSEDGEGWPRLRNGATLTDLEAPALAPTKRSRGIGLFLVLPVALLTAIGLSIGLWLYAPSGPTPSAESTAARQVASVPPVVPTVHTAEPPKTVTTVNTGAMTTTTSPTTTAPVPTMTSDPNTPKSAAPTAATAATPTATVKTSATASAKPTSWFNEEDP